MEETRTRLSGFLTRMLEEVEIGMSEGSANVRDLDEARAARTLDGRRPLGHSSRPVHSIRLSASKSGVCGLAHLVIVVSLELEVQIGEAETVT